ncbi:MAG: hypothetical protein OXU30_00295 [Gammaproteobacteria bacterium]|nr:hypothetical protein [Gammaproteobacteria bacterium]
MNWEAVGAISEIIGALAVVATLAYLAVQIRQSNDLLRSESRQTLVSNDVTSLNANIDHSKTFAKYVTNECLSAEEQLQLGFMFTLDLRNREFEYFQYKNGLLDEETWLAYRHVIVINHSSELGKKWWNAVGRGIVDPTFAALIDDLLKNAEPDDTYVRMASWADT